MSTFKPKKKTIEYSATICLLIDVIAPSTNGKSGRVCRIAQMIITNAGPRRRSKFGQLNWACLRNDIKTKFVERKNGTDVAASAAGVTFGKHKKYTSLVWHINWTLFSGEQMCVRVRACDRNQNVIYPSARCRLTMLHGKENKIRHRQTGQT